MADELKFLVEYHLTTSNAYMFHSLADWATESANTAAQKLWQINKNETIATNLSSCGSAAFAALSSRVSALGMALLQAVDVVTAKAFVRPVWAVTIFFDSGLNIEALKRASMAAGLALAITACKIGVAAGSVLIPEFTLGYLQLEKQIAQMQFWCVALRLSSEKLTWFAERNSTIPASELRGHFVHECMNRYRDFHGKHYGPLYTEILRPTSRELSNYMRIYRDLIRQLHLQMNTGVGETTFHVPRQDTSLESSPFSILFGEKIAIWGNFFIDQGHYAKEEIETFMGSDYVAVLNTALLYTILDLFQMSGTTIQFRQTGMAFTSEDVGSDVFNHINKLKSILENHSKLSTGAQDALKWHLCCDDDKMRGRLIPQESSDYAIIREIIADIAKIRIELVEQRIAASATSILQNAFDKLHAPEPVLLPSQEQ